MKKKRILIFAIDYFPYVGGAEIAVREICRRLTNLEFVMIAARNSRKIPKEEFIDNVRVIRVGLGWRSLDKYIMTFPAFLTALKLYRENNFQIVWGLMANTASLAALCLKCWHSQVTYLLTLQEGESLDYYWQRTWFWRPLYKAIFRRADFIQAISNYLAGWARDFGYRGEIFLVPNGVPVKSFGQSQPKEEIERLRKNLGIAAEEKVVITTSRLARKNGIEYLIRGFALFKNRTRLPAKLLVVGEGELIGDLKKIATELGLVKDVLFLGFVEYNRLPLYLQLADVFVRPSLTEGLGNSFLEAMACGLPVVGTPVGGIVDFLENGRTGIFCKPADADSVSKAIEIILNDDNLRDNLIKNGKALINEKYDWDIIAGQMLCLFNKFSEKS